MRVYLGGDHAGFELKSQIARHLTAAGHEVVDCGAHTYDALDDYPAFCIDAAKRVVADPGSLGIVLGGSGNGEQIAANKVPGIRAVTAHDSYSVERSVLSNDAQVLCMGQRVIGRELMLRLAHEWIGYTFDPSSPSREKVQVLTDYENR